MKRLDLNTLITLILCFICFSFIILPILHLFTGLEGESFWASVRDAEVWSAIWISFVAAGFSTVMGLILGVPTGFLLARRRFRGREFLESITNLPIVIPHVAVGIILLDLLNENSSVGSLFSRLGISFVDTIYGIVAAMCLVSISYIISSSIMGFRAVDPELEWTARSLGASPWYTFTRVTLPLVFPYLLRGSILSFARAVSEVGALLILAYYPKTAPILLYERFENYGLKSAKPIAALVILLSLFLFTLLVLTSTPKRGERDVS